MDINLDRNSNKEIFEIDSIEKLFYNKFDNGITKKIMKEKFKKNNIICSQNKFDNEWLNFNKIIRIFNNLLLNINDNDEKSNYFIKFLLQNKPYRRILWYKININYFRSCYWTDDQFNFIKSLKSKIYFYNKLKNLNQNKDLNFMNILSNINIQQENCDILSKKKYEVLNKKFNNSSINIAINEILDENKDLSSKILNKINILGKFFENNKANLKKEYDIKMNKIKQNYINYKNYNYFNILNHKISLKNNFSKWKYIQNFKEDDIVMCVICLKNNFSQNNYLIFCDGCNKGVHRKCYGINHKAHKINKWYCEKCDYIKNKPIGEINITCKICYKDTGIMKKVYVNEFNSMLWLHLNCVYWLNHNNLYSIINKKKIENSLNKFNYKNECCICEETNGFKLKCKVECCEKYFHPECHSLIFLNLKEINFEIKDSIFYSCIFHNNDNLIKNNTDKYINYLDKINIITKELILIDNKNIKKKSFKIKLKKIDKNKMIIIPKNIYSYKFDSFNSSYYNYYKELNLINNLN